MSLAQELQKQFSNASHIHCLLKYGKHKKGQVKKCTKIEYCVQKHGYF